MNYEKAVLTPQQTDMPNQKIFVIVGKAAAGKDTLAKDLSREMGIPKNISYTTRPPREGETDGIDYHFTKNEDFKDEYFIAIQEFDSVMGKIKYGMKRSDIEACRNLIIVASPSGFIELKDRYKDKVVGFYIMSPRQQRWERYLERGRYDHNTVVEAERRFRADDRDFHDFEFIADYLILNNGEYLDTLGHIMDLMFVEMTLK